MKSQTFFILLPRDTWLFLLPLWDNDHPKLGGSPTGISRLEKVWCHVLQISIPMHLGSQLLDTFLHLTWKSLIPSQSATFGDHCLDCLTHAAIATWSGSSKLYINPYKGERGRRCYVKKEMTLLLYTAFPKFLHEQTLYSFHRFKKIYEVPMTTIRKTV